MIFNNGLKIGTGIALGVGALMVAPALIPAVAAVVRPLAKATIKSGLILFEKSRELIAETAEVVEDLAAEARAELIAENQGTSSTTSDTVVTPGQATTTE